MAKRSNVRAKQKSSPASPKVAMVAPPPALLMGMTEVFKILVNSEARALPVKSVISPGVMGITN